MNIILLHSPGIDSTAFLYNLLQNTSNNILSLHIAFDSFRGRVDTYWVQEQWKWFEEKGYTFQKRIIQINENEYQNISNYSTVFLREISKILNKEPSWNRIASGRCKEEENSTTVDWDYNEFNTISGRSYLEMRLLSPFRDVSKKIAFEAIPPDLRKLIWGCQTPLKDPSDSSIEESLQCHICSTCQSYENLGYMSEIYWITSPSLHEPESINNIDWSLNRPT